MCVHSHTPPPAPSPLRHVHSNASQSNFTTVSTWHRLLKTTQMLSSRHGSCTRWKFFHSHTPAPAHYIENIAGRLDDHLCIYKMVEVSGQKVRHVVHFSTNWMYHSISVDMEVYLPKDKSVKLSVLHACTPIGMDKFVPMQLQLHTHTHTSTEQTEWKLFNFLNWICCSKLLNGIVPTYCFVYNIIIIIILYEDTGI